jgi:hypothetical protein
LKSRQNQGKQPLSHACRSVCRRHDVVPAILRNRMMFSFNPSREAREQITD